MRKVHYRANPKGMIELATSRSVQNACLEGARIVESAARNIPVTAQGSEFDKRAYRASFRTVPAKVELARSRKSPVRGGALVINDHEMERYFGGSSRTLYKALGALNGVKIG